MSANAWCTREVWGFIHYLCRCYNLLNIVRSGDISCWDMLQNDKGEHRCHQPQWAGSKARPRGKGGGGWCDGSADAITAARYQHRLGTRVHWHPLKFTTQPEKNVAGRLFLYLEYGLWECIKVFDLGLSQLDEHIEHPPTITSWPTKIFYKYLHIIICIYICVCVKKKHQRFGSCSMGHDGVTFWDVGVTTWAPCIKFESCPCLHCNPTEIMGGYGWIIRFMDLSDCSLLFTSDICWLQGTSEETQAFSRVLYPALLQPRTLINCCLYPEGSGLVHCSTRLAHFGVIHIPCCDPGGAQPSQEPEEDTGGSAPGGASGSTCGARASGAAPGGASAGRLPGGADAEIAISTGQIYGKINMGQPSRFP